MVECAWVITNIASGDSKYVDDLVQWGVVSKVIKLLSHSDSEVQENALWLASNIAGDCSDNRDILISNGIVSEIARLYEANLFANSLIVHVAWLISNLCRGKPYPDFYEVIYFLVITVNWIIDYTFVSNSSSTHEFR